ncbi:MAG: hypothetical protein H6868_09365 [Rhodospirillales bacterium]|nr:hypothetical protein [Rhodospirillales bacterium]
MNFSVFHFSNTIQVHATAPAWMRRIFDKRKRIPLLDLVKLAPKYGWDFCKPNSLEILDFIDALTQAGLDGELIFWGRPDRNDFADLTRNEPLNKIPQEEWKNFDIHWAPFFHLDHSGQITGFKDDNFEILAYDPRTRENENKYKDIYISNKKLSKWLKTSARDFKGRREAQQKQA